MFPNESAEYRKARNNLLELEIRARRATEDAARARRELPLGGEVPEDFVFQECDAGGNVRNVKLSELFTPPLETLVIYTYMFGPKRAEPCPMCTSWIDGLNGVLRHIRQRAAFVVTASSSPERLNMWARERGWDVRLVSSANNNFNKYYVSGDDKDNMAAQNVFVKRGGKIYHTYATELEQADPGQDSRGADALSPVFNFFDLTPEGRGFFYTKLKYPEKLVAPDKTVEGKPIPRESLPQQKEL